MLSHEESRENPERGRIRPTLERSPLRFSTERGDPTSTANYDSKSTASTYRHVRFCVVADRTEAEPLFDSSVPPPRLAFTCTFDENPQQAQPIVLVLLAAR